MKTIQTDVAVLSSLEPGGLAIHFKYDGINWSGIFLSREQVERLVSAGQKALIATEEERENGPALLEMKCELVDPEI